MSTAADDSHDENYISMAPSAAIRVKSNWTSKCVYWLQTGNMHYKLIHDMDWTCCNMECCLCTSEVNNITLLNNLNNHSMCSGEFKLATFQSLPHM